MADKSAAAGDPGARDFWLRAADEAVQREPEVRELTEAQWTRPESEA
jgi:hypothetical protein